MDGTLLNKKYKLEERITALEEGGGYELPIASANTLGGVKIGDNLTIDEGGVLSAELPDYSTSEQATGQKWIDGKDVYFKVYHADQLGNNADVTLEEDFGASKTVIKTEGVVGTSTENGKYQYDATYYTNGNDCVFVCVVQNDLIARCRDNYSGYSGNFIVYYTKDEVTKKRSARKKSDE